jgi:hypothetical protein
MGFSVISDSLAKIGSIRNPRNPRNPRAASRKPRRAESCPPPPPFAAGGAHGLEYAIASRRQASVQLRQTTHRVASMVPFFESIHEDLHDFSQNPQRVQFSELILMRKREKREIAPSAVPTGQIVLHHVLALLDAR